MNRIKSALLALAATIFSSGCAMVAPQYSASLDNVQALKDAGNYTAKVGEFQAGKDKAYANPISIRGSTLMSPYNNSYANYVAEALKQELSFAKKLSPDAGTEITGIVLKNDIDATGVNVGITEIEARFIVRRADQVRYDQVKAVKHEFPSSFAGAIAIPKAVQEYSVAVQKLLSLVYKDQAFVDALK